MESTVSPSPEPTHQQDPVLSGSTAVAASFTGGALLQKKRRDRLLLVSFRMPQGLKERLEEAAKRHELNQTDIINEAIELNLQRYL
ncbi:MAG: ribbon-helix-helix protein, CopG family [Janthinobacterium lividum]